jgi:hypothetical protein
MRKGAGIKLMAQNMLLCFKKISAEILLYILGYNFLHQKLYFGALSPNAAAIKSNKNFLRKS